MEEYNVSDLVDNIDFNSFKFNDFGHGILLTNSEVSILDKYNIDYKSCIDLKELIFKIEYYLDEYEYNLDDLDNVCSSISERDYYWNTNK